MLVGAGAAWGIFRLAMNNERLPPGISTVIVEVVLGLALFMAVQGLNAVLFYTWRPMF